MDVWMLACMLFVFAALFEYTTVKKIAKSKENISDLQYNVEAHIPRLPSALSFKSPTPQPPSIQIKQSPRLPTITEDERTLPRTKSIEYVDGNARQRRRPLKAQQSLEYYDSDAEKVVRTTYNYTAELTPVSINDKPQPAESGEHKLKYLTPITPRLWTTYKELMAGGGLDKLKSLQTSPRAEIYRTTSPTQRNAAQSISGANRSYSPDGKYIVADKRHFS